MRWPRDGVPGNPEGWLLTVARNRLRDVARSAAVRRTHPFDPARHDPARLDDVDPDAIGDRRLELMLVCAHPAIDRSARTPLMLNTVLGLTAKQVAAAFALPAPTVAARLVRSKRRIGAARIPFEIPDRSVLPERVDHVLEAVYGAYAVEWRIAGAVPRGTPADEALYLAETLADLLPGDPEAHGLAALVCFSTARAPARLDDAGRLVPLGEQDTTRWDGALLERGRLHLRAAYAGGELGRFQLEAAIQAVHAARATTGTTDWPALRDLHRHLSRLFPSLGARVALAAVTAETDGPEAALALLDELDEDGARFQPAWATRADLLRRLGRRAESRAAYDKAVSLTTDPAERAFLQSRRPAA
ncbi:RNA polymerase sigma factor [Isoptericola variabilis]|uniref:RNA polymerase sigma factor n=1 Tax=Isoptericola variabilis TaxID=139208 RepID=UPI0002F79A27|nr:DUF6596 domain-containing protein [Isoptericola variabilis]TWH34419.1 RNA polymerase sigma-70 factor (ECF subfamily) [Isoptericola variabilis J7]